MPSFTKKAIVETFLHLVAKKPLEKITVRDVVDECGINRNTFYYYFQDIYAVLEGLCDTAIEEIPHGCGVGEALSAFFGILAEFSLTHMRAVQHLLASVGRDGAERYFAEGLDAVIDGALARSGEKDAVERRFTVLFLRHAVIGIFADWLADDGKREIGSVAARIAAITDRTVKNTDKS
ncbi:MAG: TetR family transcriptional regulator [Ruminococcaceae bacterium]|nr:TetR family transcriptional regulator [Oscillospiraceae bacterium]